MVGFYFRCLNPALITHLLKILTFHEVAETKNIITEIDTAESDTLDQNSDIEIIDEDDHDMLYAISTRIQETIAVEQHQANLISI